jgi:putative ABC transport system permease protein
MSAALAALSGIVPAWRVARSGLGAAGRGTSTADASQHRLRASLVVAEIAVALVLVTGAGLLIRSFVGLIGVDPGFARERVLVMQVFAWDYNPGADRLRAFFDAATARLSALPAVQQVGAVSAMPFIESNINIQGSIVIAGRPQPPDTETPRSHFTIATPGYFEAMRIPLKAGRLLNAADGPRSKSVAVISETLAHRYWPEGDDPIGDTIRFRLSGAPVEVEVVGIVASLRHDRLDRPARDEIFLPLAQRPFGSMTFVVRAAGDASTLLEPARQAIWAINPAQTIYRAATLDELVENTVSPRRFALGVMLGFAALALVLAIAGIYGVLSAITIARRRELGLRVALGASRADVVALTLRSGARMAGLGLLIGLAGSLGAAQLLRSFLFGVTPLDPPTLGAAAVLMATAATAACYLPARRAAEADPVAVLRSD